MDGSGNVTFPANATCSGTATGFGGGKLLQVKQGGRNDTASQSISARSHWDGANIQVSITPASASSQILILANTCYTTSNAVNNTPVVLQKKTGSGSFANITAANGADDGNRIEVMTASYQTNTYHISPQSFNYLDTAGSTDELTYRVIYYNVSSYTRTIYINKFHSESNDTGTPRSSSWIQVMEIAA
tara:strand:- start:1292 stop:1855 length:564 start_codon:yes stop_codon:yes gene_type:complete